MSKPNAPRTAPVNAPTGPSVVAPSAPKKLSFKTGVQAGCCYCPGGPSCDH